MCSTRIARLWTFWSRVGSVGFFKKKSLFVQETESAKRYDRYSSLTSRSTNLVSGEIRVYAQKPGKQVIFHWSWTRGREREKKRANNVKWHWKSGRPIVGHTKNQNQKIQLKIKRKETRLELTSFRADFQESNERVPHSKAVTFWGLDILLKVIVFSSRNTLATE